MLGPPWAGQIESLGIIAHAMQCDDDSAWVGGIPMAQRQMQPVAGEEIIGGDGGRVGGEAFARDFRRAGRQQHQSASKRRTRRRK
jgi:hypothetical protein